MADNTDYKPISIEVKPPHERNDLIINGRGNIVEPTASNVIVNGDGNYVGHDCTNVNILNSSGITVFPNVTGSVVIGSSGIIIQDNDLVYINNNLLSGSGTPNIEPVLVNADYTATADDYWIIIINSGVTVTFPDYNNVGAKEWRVKNISGGDSYIYTAASSGFDNESPIVSTYTLINNDAVILYAYYTYILIF